MNDAEKLGMPEAPKAPEAPVLTISPDVNDMADTATGGENPNGPQSVKQTRGDRRTSEKRVHRVGTATMGVALIIAGLAICAGLFRPTTDFSMLLKLSPLVLVALGIEVLIAAAKKDVRLKYDFLSMFVCFLLIVASLGASCVSWLFDYAGPARRTAERRVEETIEAQIYEQIKGGQDVSSLRCDVSLALSPMRTADSVQDANDLTASDYVTTYVDMTGSWADETAFAEACRPVIDAVAATGLPDPRIQFSMDQDSRSTDPIYSLYVSGPYQLAMSAADLAKQVTKQMYVEEAGYWMDEHEYDRWQQERASDAEMYQRELDEMQARIEEAEQRVYDAEERAAEAEQRAAEAEERLAQIESSLGD